MRKFFGILFIVLGVLIAIGSIFPLLDMFSKASHLEPNFEHKSFFLIGSLLGFGLINLVACLTVFAGLKLYGKKKDE